MVAVVVGICGGGIIGCCSRLFYYLGMGEFYTISTGEIVGSIFGVFMFAVVFGMVFGVIRYMMFGGSER